MNDDRKPLSREDVAPPRADKMHVPRPTVSGLIAACLSLSVTLAFFAILGGFVSEVIEAAWDWGREIGNWVTFE